MRKYWAVFKTNFLGTLVYRADVFFWGAGELLETIVFLFVWMVIFGEKQAIGGFTLPETITYLIGVGIIVKFVSSWAGHDLQQDVQTGGLSNILIKPIRYPLWRSFSSLAEKPLDFLIHLGAYLIVALFFREKLIINQDFWPWFLFLFSVFLAFIINQLVDFCFGCLSFWTITTRGMFQILRAVVAIFSGGYAPITFFPIWFQRAAHFLPFIYIRYFPMLIYLEKIGTPDILKGIGIQILWIVILYYSARTVWRRGLKRYEGVGI